MPLGCGQLLSGALHDWLYLFPAILLAEEVLVPLQPALPTTQRLQEQKHLSVHHCQILSHTDAGEHIQMEQLIFSDNNDIN